MNFFISSFPYLFLIAVSITGFVISVINNSYAFVARWGYLGLFIMTLVEAGTIYMVSLGSFAFVFTFGGILNPFLVAFSASLGSAIGSVTNYILGLGGKELLEKKYDKQLGKAKEYFLKYGSFFWIFIVAMTPLPDGIPGVFCGSIRYDFKKYILAMFISKMVLNLFLAYSGYYSIGWVRNLIGARFG